MGHETRGLRMWGISGLLESNRTALSVLASEGMLAITQQR